MVRMGREDETVQIAAIHCCRSCRSKADERVAAKAFEAQVVANATTIFSKRDDHTPAGNRATGPYVFKSWNRFEKDPQVFSGWEN